MSSTDDARRASPRRIQLSRKRGWKMPENTVKVARPSRWGNPFKVAVHGRDEAVKRFELLMVSLIEQGGEDLTPLRGKNLACWCPLDQPCHADVLLRMANAAPRGGEGATP